MIRDDLMALTPEAVAALSNLGLVKRAQREIAEGKGPAIAMEEDSTVVGTFEGNVVARLVPKTTLRDCPCTCGAVTVCRHRVATALAYPEWQRAHSGESAADQGAVEWNPGDVEDDALLAFVGKRMTDRATLAARGGLVITVAPWSERERTPVARLPSTTVRFHVPRDLAYARCDCAVGVGCEHVVLAVWAFRAASADGPITAPRTVSIGAAAAPPAATGTALADAVALAREVLATGIAHVTPALAGRFAHVRTTLERERLVWPLDAIEDLERTIEAYAARSARYDERRAAQLLTEIVGRARAGRGTGELPARFVLGAGQPRETLLDHVRLVSLGARVEADGATRYADVFLADPDTGDVLAFEKRWDFAEAAAPEEGPTLARRSALAGVTLGALAHGQVVTRAAKRRANGLVAFGSNRTHTSVTPQRGDWDALPAPLLARDFAALDRHLQSLAPRMLRPRLLAEGFHVAKVSAVERIAYVAAEQRVVAVARDEAAQPLLLERVHTSAAPFVVGAVVRACQSELRFAAGPVHRTERGLVLEPLALALASGEVVVPDLATEASSHDVDAVVRHERKDPLSEALADLEHLVAEAAHVGLAHLPSGFRDRAERAERRLRGVGLERLGSLAAGLRGGGAGKIAADSWFDAAIAVEVAREIA